MADKRQNPIEKNIDAGIYPALRKAAETLTSCSNLDEVFINLYSSLEKLIPMQQFKLGLTGKEDATIYWVFRVENNKPDLSVSKTGLDNFSEEVLSGGGSISRMLDDKRALVRVLTPVRLCAQNLGLMDITTHDNISLPKYLEFLDLVAFYLAFVFEDLNIENEKLVRKNSFHRELSEAKLLNQKLLSIIDVARSLAHELNQPLTGISGYCTLILETIDESEPQAVKGDLEKILRQAARLEELIFKFQSIAHIEGRPDKIII